MEDIKVSVICMCYNHEKYIEQALKSMLMQKTDFSFEIIVHDDASTDRSAEIIMSMSQKYPIIKPIIELENQYSKKVKKVYVYETISSMIKGKYVAICEGDDYWTDVHKLQKQYDFLEKHEDYTCCAHNTIIFDCNKNKECGVFCTINEETDFTFNELIMYDYSPCNFHTSSFFYRKEYYVERPEFFFITKGIGDFPMKINLALNGKIHYFPQAMSVYRLFSSSTAWSMRNNKNDQKQNNLRNILLLLEYLNRTVNVDKTESIKRSIGMTEIELSIYSKDFKGMIVNPYFQQLTLFCRCKKCIKYIFVNFFTKVIGN